MYIKRLKFLKKNVDIYHHNIHVCILHEHLKLAVIYDLIISSIYFTSLPKIYVQELNYKVSYHLLTCKEALKNMTMNV